ncbi:MAG: response regulator [Nocardioidaceae bacterium]
MLSIWIGKRPSRGLAACEAGSRAGNAYLEESAKLIEYAICIECERCSKYLPVPDTRLRVQPPALQFQRVVAAAQALELAETGDLAGADSIVAQLEDIDQLTKTKPARRSSDTMKILVADDSMVMRRLLVSFLQDWDYEVLEAEDGEQAWSVCERKCFSGVDRLDHARRRWPELIRWI